MFFFVKLLNCYQKSIQFCKFCKNFIHHTIFKYYMVIFVVKPDVVISNLYCDFFFAKLNHLIYINVDSTSKSTTFSKNQSIIRFVMRGVSNEICEQKNSCSFGASVADIRKITVTDWKNKLNHIIFGFSISTYAVIMDVSQKKIRSIL